MLVGVVVDVRVMVGARVASGMIVGEVIFVWQAAIIETKNTTAKFRKTGDFMVILLTRYELL